MKYGIIGAILMFLGLFFSRIGANIFSMIFYIIGVAFCLKESVEMKNRRDKLGK